MLFPGREGGDHVARLVTESEAPEPSKVVMGCLRRADRLWASIPSVWSPDQQSVLELQSLRPHPDLLSQNQQTIPSGGLGGSCVSEAQGWAVCQAHCGHRLPSGRHCCHGAGGETEARGGQLTYSRTHGRWCGREVPPPCLQVQPWAFCIRPHCPPGLASTQAQKTQRAPPRHSRSLRFPPNVFCLYKPLLHRVFVFVF